MFMFTRSADSGLLNERQAADAKRGGRPRLVFGLDVNLPCRPETRRGEGGGVKESEDYCSRGRMEGSGAEQVYGCYRLDLALAARGAQTCTMCATFLAPTSLHVKFRASRFEAGSHLLPDIIFLTSFPGCLFKLLVSDFLLTSKDPFSKTSPHPRTLIALFGRRLDLDLGLDKPKRSDLSLHAPQFTDKTRTARVHASQIQRVPVIHQSPERCGLTATGWPLSPNQSKSLDFMETLPPPHRLVGSIQKEGEMGKD
ncbi:hypothetical protein RRG08_061970 [Elysia crispata]|uniref:Uncharacterized protein n=1 Tax=Elysia crispata TaxID=231223 RepID=A0AAE0ZIL9_9GAST|nr:hypothetical protein RRG08_061970 [Elysia crispata]